MKQRYYWHAGCITYVTLSEPVHPYQIMYDIPTLKNLFERTGFINIKEVKWGESDYDALKNIEHCNKRGEKLNKDETAILECEKRLYS